MSAFADADAFPIFLIVAEACLASVAGSGTAARPWFLPAK
jgi:hypothetical protein